MLLARYTLLCVMFLTGCSSTTPPSSASDSIDPNNDLSYLAKSDIDTVADIHLRQVDQYLKELTYKLYRRNPRHCDGGTAHIEQCVTRLFNPHTNRKLAINKAITNIELSFDNKFTGDRVGNFVLGLRSMIHRAYSDKTEFFFFDELDPQKLYNSARNIEIAIWRLSNYRDDNGKLFLLTNGLNTQVKNLSFERLFGKLVATQDTIAAIIAESSRRRIKNVIQRLATAVFLPI